MNSIVITNEERRPIAELRVAEMAQHWGIPRAAIYETNLTERGAWVHVLSEFCVGDGPWLIYHDDIRFRMHPARLGLKSDLHLYGGYPADTNPMTLDSIEPDAILVMNHDMRRQLIDTFANATADIPEAWMPLLRVAPVSWDSPPTIDYVTE